MYQFVSVLVILVSILLILIVLVQNSKGGGLASNFSASNQVMGVRKTADFLEKATWTLAGALLVLSFVSVMVLPKGQMQSGSAIDEEIQNMTAPTQELPDFGVGEGEATPSGGTVGDSL
ncbi:MAG: preprotein translocase subunit SecG [Anaerophaga sp.]|uniref:preprotein translocase subunit SecG n=1 Tax=Anaerophaga thermohalophila TaxID=177400 RepID=UPI000237C282|nr:preprotein translocase subunit SecG [Anaerophaga thermohalophila]MBZ4675879.1 preprotein translocase subunit SecG [Anaerophaga sp.]MDI3521603.1 preprotein translocase subunit SecG [Anaerophaga sp.]MDK2843165.1 preprotein translocase subunit SecG [Anaerophaga sp.]MDN5290131.1 preprotein translocase subunit SecG [Anaerophaga sp.]